MGKKVVFVPFVKKTWYVKLLYAVLIKQNVVTPFAFDVLREKQTEMENVRFVKQESRSFSSNAIMFYQHVCKLMTKLPQKKVNISQKKKWKKKKKKRKEKKRKITK